VVGVGVAAVVCRTAEMHGRSGMNRWCMVQQRYVLRPRCVVRVLVRDGLMNRVLEASSEVHNG
jgi:hypothetical protein